MKKFTRTTEDFDCQNCGTYNIGNGYTNHCFHCLWSRHVDVDPGDRANNCHGLMEPIGYDQKHGILHRCVSCRLEKYNKVQAQDDPEQIIQLASIIQMPL